MKDGLERWIIKFLGARISPAYYIIVASSLICGIFSILTFQPHFEAFGILLIIGAILVLLGFRREDRALVGTGSAISYITWIFINIVLIISGSYSALLILGIPYVLYFAYFFLGREYYKFWR